MPQSSVHFELRHPSAHEYEMVNRLVQTIVDEVYGGLWADPPLPIGHTEWQSAWVAVMHGAIVGVALTQTNRVEDLWVFANARRAGIGFALLSRCESEIAARGYATAALRVVSSNQKALRFYSQRGWAVQREYPHERFSVPVTEMTKDVHA